MGRQPKQRSIARRLFTSVTLVVLCSMGLLASIFFTLAGQYIYNENLNNLNAAVEQVGQVLAMAETEIPNAALREKLTDHAAALVTEVTEAELLVADSDGRVIYTSGVPLSGEVLSERMQERFKGKTPAEVRAEALATDTPAQYPIPENKRIQKYKARYAA